GDLDNEDSPFIWVEVQFQGWVLDAGIFGLILYPFALFVTMRNQYGVAVTTRNRDLQQAAAMVLASCFGVVAVVFGFTPFTNQVGMQYWFLVGALYGAWVHEHAAMNGSHRLAYRQVPPQ